MDGIEATKLIRETGYTQPVVALTANAIAGQSEIFRENGFDEFISKPIDIRQLDSIINKLIRDKQPPEVIEEAKRSSVADEMAGQARRDVGSDSLSALKSMNGLNVDSALDAMSGLEDVYIDTIKLTVRLLPDRIEKMDKYIESDMNSFTVEVHGLKSVLKNIGAAALGNKAASLERAALDKDKPYCDENYPPFRAALTELSESLNTALSLKESKPKEASDTSELLQAMTGAKNAAESFDRDSALEALSPLMEFTYGEETDGLLKEIVFALEAFDCEKALGLMDTMSK
jgi:CheY-like chemotaxis protein